MFSVKITGYLVSSSAFCFVLTNIKQKHFFSPNINIMKVTSLWRNILLPSFWTDKPLLFRGSVKCVIYSRICRLLFTETAIAYIQLALCPQERKKTNPISLEIFYLIKKKKKERQAGRKTERQWMKRTEKEKKRKLQSAMIWRIWKFISKNKVSKPVSGEIFSPVYVLLVHSNAMWKVLKILEENLGCYSRWWTVMSIPLNNNPLKVKNIAHSKSFHKYIKIFSPIKFILKLILTKSLDRNLCVENQQRYFFVVIFLYLWQSQWDGQERNRTLSHPLLTLDLWIKVICGGQACSQHGDNISVDESPDSDLFSDHYTAIIVFSSYF